MPFVTKTIILTVSGNWIVPADFTTPNKIEAIGGAQGGGFNHGSGGGAGAYTFLDDVILTPGASIPVVIGAGGAGASAPSNFGLPGSPTSFNSGQIFAHFGGWLLHAGGRGLSCVPHGASGGDGGTNGVSRGSGGGGGAGGPSGVGASGGGNLGISSFFGAGGAGSNGGGAGQDATIGSAGIGGIARGGTPGGGAGLPGANGSGGGGGSTGEGGTGSADPIWLSLYGPGSGGGGGFAGSAGGFGGLFGGGGGGGTPGGRGGQGVIAITYLGTTPEPPIPPIPPVPPPVIPGPPLRERTYHRRFLGLGFDPQITIVKDRPGPIRIIEFDAWMN